MFQGTLPPAAQQILGMVIKEWETDDLYIGCSGNFTIQRMIKATHPNVKIHGNDVTVYSCLLGRYFAGKPLNVRYNDSYSGKMQFVKDYMNTDIDVIATIMLLSSMGNYIMSKQNPYYEKMIDEYVKQWDVLHKKTKERFEKIEPFLSSFYQGDICVMVDEVPEQAALICYPPFYAGDYEKMFKCIEKFVIWEQPKYEMINKDRILQLFRKMTKKKYFAFGTNDYIEQFKDYLVGITKTTNRGVPLYLYARADKSHIVMPCQDIKNLMCERIGPQEDIGNEMKIMPLNSMQFHALRSQYMNPYIKPGQETASYGVLVDNKLIGVYAFSASPTLSNWDTHIDTPTMYLLSDFPIAPTKYKRMAKLVLYAALSSESKAMAQQMTKKRVRSLITTAFTKRPVSMKYRGLFKLLNKKEMERSDESSDLSTRYYNQGYQLNYGAKMGEWTLAEGLQMWKDKHSQTEGETES